MPTPAAIIYGPHDDVDALLARFADELRQQGTRVGGVVQHNRTRIEACATDMELEDLLSGERLTLCQELGRGALACRLDGDALARAAVAIRQALTQQVELVIVNKFGAQEAGGKGLRDEIAMTVLDGRPLLTAVAERFLDAWMQFLGEPGLQLAATPEALRHWWACNSPDKI